MPDIHFHMARFGRWRCASPPAGAGRRWSATTTRADIDGDPPRGESDGYRLGLPLSRKIGTILKFVPDRCHSPPEATESGPGAGAEEADAAREAGPG